MCSKSSSWKEGLGVKGLLQFGMQRDLGVVVGLMERGCISLIGLIWVSKQRLEAQASEYSLIEVIQ